MAHPTSRAALPIGIASYTFYQRFQAGTMDFPQFFAAVRGAGVHLVELNSPFFASHDPNYITAIKHAAATYGITIVNLAIDDYSYDLSATDDTNRQQAVQRTIAWLDIAVALDCLHVRNNTGGDNFAHCQQSFLELAAAAKARGRRIAIEAHGGFSSDAATLLPLVDAVRTHFPDQIGIIPDFGNVVSTPERDRYQQITDMAPYAFLVHPKMHDFDAAGQQREWDTPRLVQSVHRTGFAGPWIIEFEGNAEDFTGLEQSLTLLTACLTPKGA